MLHEKNFLNQTLAQEAERKRLEKLQNQFTPKFYFHKYRNEYRLVMVAKYLFSFISIATAFYFVFTLMNKAIGIELLAVLLAIALLFCLEYAKHLLCPKILIDFYGFGKINVGLALVNGLLIVGSIYLSVKGIENYSNEVLAIKPQPKSLDSLRLVYQKRIDKLHIQISETQKAMNWQGKTTPKGIAQIEAIRGEIGYIQSEMTKHLSETQNHNQQAENQAKTLNSINTFYLIAFSGVNELLCLLCLWFGVYYAFKSSKEVQAIQSNMMPLQFTQNDIPLIFEAVKHFINASKDSPYFLPTNQGQNQIGFHTANKEQNQNLNEAPKNNDLRHIKDTSNTSNEEEKEKAMQAEKNRQFLRKYEAVVNDIKEGLTYSQILKNKYPIEGRNKPISESTLINIKRVLNNL
jgi:hypothetical protein